MRAVAALCKACLAELDKRTNEWAMTRESLHLMPSIQGVLSSRVPEADQAAALAAAALSLLRRQLAEPFDLTLLRHAMINHDSRPFSC